MTKEILETDDGITVGIFDDKEMSGDKLDKIFIESNEFDILESSLESPEEIIDLYENKNYPKLKVRGLLWDLKSRDIEERCKNIEYLNELIEENDSIYAVFQKWYKEDDINFEKLKREIKNIRHTTETIKTGEVPDIS
jgi:hypothetical protein